MFDSLCEMGLGSIMLLINIMVSHSEPAESAPQKAEASETEHKDSERQ